MKNMNQSEKNYYSYSNGKSVNKNKSEICDKLDGSNLFERVKED
jgi:hypothetical protein